MANEEVLELQIRDNAQQAATALDSLTTALGKVKSAVGKGLELTLTATAIGKLRSAINGGISKSALSSWQRFANALEKIKENSNVNLNGIKNATAGSGLPNLKADVNDTMNNVVDAVDMGTEQVNSRLGDMGSGASGVAGIIRSLFSGDSLSSGLKNALEDLKTSLTKIKDKAFEVIGAFTRIAKYRFIRFVIKQITEAFSTGIENVYWYSKALGTDFSSSMDSAASTLLQFKNSLGAAVAPLIQSFIPAINSAVNALINLINYVNQFISLLTGSNTWTRAIYKPMQAFEDQTKKTTKASKKAKNSVKELLADWDELNIIQSETSSGGGGSAGKPTAMEEAVKMFTTEYDFIAGLKKYYQDILGIVKKIGLVLAAWKLSSALTGVVGSLASLVALGGTIALTFDVTTLLNKAYMDTGNPGWLLMDILTTAVGAFFAKTIAKKMFGSLGGIGAKAGTIAMSLTVVISAIADIISVLGNVDTDALSPENILTSIKGGLKLGAGVAILGKGLLQQSMAKAGLIGLGVSALSIGVLIGIQGIIGAVKTGDITTSSIANAVGSALATGLGVTILGKTFGLAFTTAAALGGVAALALGIGFAVTLGVIALINADRKHVEWGDRELSESEVNAFTENEMFKANIKAELTLLETTVKKVGPEKKAEIEQQIAAATGDLEIIRLGLATNDTLNSLKKKLFGDTEDGSGGVIGELKEYAKNKENLITLSFKLMPLKDSEGNVNQAVTDEFTKAGVTGWRDVTEYMTALGKDLGDALTLGVDQSIADLDTDLIETLMTKIQNVKDAIFEAQVSSTATSNLAKSLKNFSSMSSDQILAAYENYQQELRDKFQETQAETYASYVQLEAFYLTRGAEGDLEKAKEMREKADYLLENWNKEIERSVDEAAKPGRDLIARSYAELFSLDDNFLRSKGYFTGQKGKYFVDPFVNEIEKSIANGNGDTYIGLYLEEMLMSAAKKSLSPSNFDRAMSAWENGYLNWIDLFDNSIIDLLISEIDDPETQNLIAGAWNDLLAHSATRSSENYNVEDYLKRRFAVDTDVIKKLRNEGFLSDVIRFMPQGADTETLEGYLNSVWRRALMRGFDNVTDFNTVNEALQSGILSLSDIFDESFIDAILSGIQNEELKNKLRTAWNNLLYGLPEGSVEAKLPVEVEPEIQNENLLHEHLKEAVNKAMEDSVMSEEEKQNIISFFGEAAYKEMLQELGYKLGQNGVNTGKYTNYRLASAGYSDVSGMGRPGMGINTTQPETNGSTDQMATDMEAAQRRANQPQNDLLNQLITIATQIYRKDNTVVVRPSSEWGRLNQNSNRSLDRVMG